MVTSMTVPAVMGEARAGCLLVEDVRAGYGDRVVLQGVSLAVGPGDVIGVIGPNGGGKSTLIRAITGVVRPRGGRILIGGCPAEQLRPAGIARFVAVVPQAPVVPESFTGLEFVLLGRTPHLRLLQSEGPRDLAIAGRALVQCGALHLADRRVGELSGGERQRLLVARALAQEPRLLLLDEPTAHLDITHQAAIAALIVERCRTDGLGAVMVVHDLTLAAQFCDRLLLLADGRIMAEGQPGDVLQPELLSAAYGGRVDVIRHPQSGRPVVIAKAP